MYPAGDVSISISIMATLYLCLSPVLSLRWLLLGRHQDRSPRHRPQHHHLVHEGQASRQQDRSLRAVRVADRSAEEGQRGWQEGTVVTQSCTQVPCMVIRMLVRCIMKDRTSNLMISDNDIIIFDTVVRQKRNL